MCAVKTESAMAERTSKMRNRAASWGKPSRYKPEALVSAVTVASLLALWWLVTKLGLTSPLFLPSPVAVLQRLAEVASEGFGGANLWQHALSSFLRVFVAFALACGTAVPVGMAMGMLRFVRAVFDPLVEFYRPIPPLAYLPLVIIWFGIGEISKLVLIYLACFAPIALSTRAGVRSVSLEQIRAACSMGANPRQLVLNIVLPGAMPEILTGMRIALGFGWTTLVAAEMVAATRGLGYMVLNASEFLVTDVVVMGILAIGVIAIASDLAMRRLEQLLVPWKGRM